MDNKVLLVDPPFHAFFEYDRWWYTYGCAQIAGHLIKNGIETHVYDADKYCKKDPKTKNREEMVRRQNWYKEGVKDDNHTVWKHFRKTLEDINPDIVGVASWTSKLKSTFKILESCKKFNPKIKTCVGGYHATAKPDDFKNNPLIDAIFTGPSEHTLLEWIGSGCKQKLMTASPKSIDTRAMPMPSRESLLYKECYTTTDMSMIMTSRGCPYDCTFCSNSLLTGRKYQMRTVDQVREEIDHIISQYGVESLFVADANFLVNLKRTLEMAKLFKSYNLPWGCDGKIDMITDEFLENLIDCGCTNLSFGIETGTNKGLDILRKDITVEQVINAGKILNKHDIKWKCFFIIGFPHETLDDMEETRKLALSIGANHISLNSFVPLPGTEIFNQWESTFSSIPDLSEYNQLNPRATFIPGISPKRYREKFMSILKDFDQYNNSMRSITDFRGEKRGSLQSLYY